MVSGGTTPYSYEWSTIPLQSDSQATGLCAGIPYKVVITDANNCQDSISVTLSEPILLTANITDSTNLSCNAACDGDATVTAGGGTTPYTYLWSNTDSTTLADSLCASIPYSIIVTDSMGCQAFDTTTLSEPDVLVAAIVDSNNTSCNGICDGDATVSVTGGTLAYTYLWSNADTDTIADSLCAGVVHSVIVTDSMGCQDSVSVTLSEPQVLDVIISDSSNMSCNGDCDGTATGLIIGGTPGYIYSWSNGDADTLADSLCPNTIYTLTVTDTMGCIDSVSVTLSEPTVLTANITDSTNISCNSVCDGDATVTAGGGTTPYTYLWSNNDSTTLADTLCAVTPYSVIITDSMGCLAFDTVTLSEPAVLVANIVDSTNLSCNAACDGDATVTAGGGTTPYTYLWSNTDSTTLADSLCASIPYSIIVTDSMGCQAFDTTTLSEPDVLVAAIVDSNNTSCNGICDGDATVSVTGGTLAYTYLWSNADTDTIADSLCAGYITVQVTDDSGCVAYDSILILEPPILTVDTLSTTEASCDSSCDAQAIIVANGGTPPYTYLWDNGDTNTLADSLCTSTYYVTVTDLNSCSTIDTVVILGPDGLTSNIVDTTMVSCSGICDGAATVRGFGGTPPYTYSWIDTSSGVILGPGLTDTVITGLCAGFYYAVIKDTNNCVTTVGILITEPLPLAPSICTVNNVSCNSVCDGSAIVCPVGGTEPYSYIWSDPFAQTDSIADSLCAGNYQISVTDANGCIAIDSLINISEPTLLSCSFTDTGMTGCGVDSAIGYAVVQGNGGTTPYQYLWDILVLGSEVDTLADSLLAGTYNVTVTDTNGCTSVCAIEITDTSDMASSITDSTMVSCFGLCNGEAIVTTTGSSQPYTYNWFDSFNIAIGDTDSIGNNLCAGIHRVIVRSNANCFRSIPIEITEPDLLIATFIDTINILCNADSNGSITASISGGTQPYTYAWSDTTGSPIIDSDHILDSVSAGVYCVVITDSMGCTDSVCYVISEPDLLTINVTSTTQTTCSNTCDGINVSTAAGGTTPYTYLWLPDSTNGSTDSNLCMGTYIVTLTDANNCTAADTAEILALIYVDADAGPDQQICQKDSVTLIGSGGATYQWIHDSTLISTESTTTTTPENTGNNDYILIVNDSTCSDTDSVAVYVVPVGVDAGPEFTINEGSCVVLIGSAINGATYLWESGLTLDDPNLATPEACPLETTVYYLTATNDSGCVGVDSTIVIVKPEIPDGFTPNDDGKNDVWEIGLLEFYPNSELQIYNRWGELIFNSPEGDRYAIKFDGTFNGKNLPVGTYYYVIKLNDGETEPMTGPITIMR